MIKPIVTKDNELRIDGVVKVGDKYPSLCCPGYDCEVTGIMRYSKYNPHDCNVYLTCENKKHNEDMESDPYAGVISKMPEDIADHLQDLEKNGIITGVDTSAFKEGDEVGRDEDGKLVVMPTREQFIKAMAADGWTAVKKTSAVLQIEYIAEWKRGTITETNAAAQTHWLTTGSTPPPF